MRLILDECLPKRLARELPGYDVVTVPMAGLAGLHNGDLLRQISGRFEAFITIDSNLSEQQNTGKLPFGIVVVGAPSNKIEDIRPLIPKILLALQTLQPGMVVHVF
jgi:predicted nuclease of predicted toxin-antitoxin system